MYTAEASASNAVYSKNTIYENRVFFGNKNNNTIKKKKKKKAELQR